MNILHTHFTSSSSNQCIHSPYNSLINYCVHVSATVPHPMVIPAGALQIQTNHSQMASQPPPAGGQPPNNGPNMIGALPTDPQLSVQSVSTNSQQSTSSPTYYSDQQSAQVASQPINSANEGSLPNSIVSSPISPHLQQNGYNGAANTTNISGNGQLPNFPTQGQPHNGAQGTWSGQHTLTYTQTMMPPDPRNSQGNFCKWSMNLP